MRLRLFITIFLAYFPCVAFANAQITVCSEANYIPFEMIDAEGNWDGYEIAILKNFSKKHNYRIFLLNMGYDGLIPAITAQKRCDIIASTFAKNVERSKQVTFTNPILLTSFSAIVKLSDKNKFTSFEKINSKDVTISVQKGTENDAYAKKYLPNVNVLYFENLTDAVNAVLSGKSDIMMEDKTYIKIVAKRFEGKLSVMNGKIFKNNPDVEIAFALNKKNTKLLNELNKYIEEIQKNGVLDKLKKDYLETFTWKNKFPL